MNIEILNERVPAGGYGFVVWDEAGVVESVQINTFQYRTRHVY